MKGTFTSFTNSTGISSNVESATLASMRRFQCPVGDGGGIPIPMCISFSSIVHEILCNLSEASAFFVEVNHHSSASSFWIWYCFQWIKRLSAQCQWWASLHNFLRLNDDYNNSRTVVMHSSMIWVRYGWQVRISDLNMLLPLHLSWTLQVNSMSLSEMVSGSPRWLRFE